jgi:penicillin-binding protein 2
MIKRNNNLDKNKTINRRLFILGTAKAGLLGLITSRLYNLQISEKKKYELLSDKNRFREWKTPPKRGVITDFYNNVIADNKRVYQVHLSLDETKDFNNSIFKLKNIINLSDDELSKIYEKKQKIKPWDTIVVSENLSWEKFSKLNLYLHEIEGAKPVLSTSRYYPYSNDLVHIVGYVGDASPDDIIKNEKIEKNFVPGLKVGKIGIENSTDQILIGNYGIKRYEVNSSGKKIREISYKKETQGENLRTTIDLEAQKLAQKLLENKAGSICAMDIYSGEIIAMASSPTYDPNKFTYGINKKDWNEIKNNKLRPLVNKSIAGLYSPGSTIKPLVALAALEYGIINPNLKIKCKGHDHPYELYGQKYHCWKKNGHGIMSLRNAIKQSCDIYFYEVARLLGVDRLSIIAKRYGLGSKVLENIFSEEKKGLVPSTKWKKQVLEQSWYLGETVITGIGQGYIQTTPLQLCLMTAQLANGGFKIKPNIIYNSNFNYEEILSKIESEKNKPSNANILKDKNINLYEKLYKNPKNIKIVLDAMYGSTNEQFGTSFRSRHVDKKYRYAGKTGTSQVRRITDKDRELDLDTSEIEYKNRDHALFVAFAPYDKPKYAISVLVEHGGSGSKAAAPLANKLIKKIIDRDKDREIKRKELKII